MFFYQQLENYENRPALADAEGGHHSYGDLLEFSRRLERFFDEPPKKLVCVLARNNRESLAAYLAGLRGRAALMLLNAALNPALLRPILRAYQPDYLWRPDQNAPEAAFRDGAYELIAREPDAGSGAIHPGVKLLLSTSGSTGSPKTVMLSAENLDANARAIACYLRLDGGERPVTSLSLAYSYGLSVINSHWTVGSAILLNNASIVQKRFWNFLKAERGTSFAGVPGTYELLRRFGFFRMDLPDLHYITQAGGKLREAWVREFARHSRQKGYRFYVMYGQTEATARMAYLPPETNLEKCASVGIAVPGGRLWVENEKQERIVESRRTGELVYQGPNVMLGYATGRADLTRGRTQADILRTGDLGYCDPEGFFYVTGRKDRCVKLLGHRLNLDEIETMLQSRSYACACGGREDLLLVAHSEPARSQALKKEIVGLFNLEPAMVRVVEVAKIEKTISGKTDYRKMFRSYLRETEEETLQRPEDAK